MPLVWNMNSWKNLDLINFLKTMMEAKIFENKWVRHVRMPQFDQKRSFWVLNSPKKNVRERKIAWMYEGGATCHLAHALWWADSSCFPNACFTFSCFSKKNFFVCDHETLSYLATNSMKPISNLIKNWCSSYKWFLMWQISAWRLAKHNNHKQKSSMANNQNISHSTIHDINRWVRSFDFSTKTNFTAYKLEGIKALRNVKIKWDFLHAIVKF